MRLFLAVDVDAAVQAGIGRIAEGVRAAFDRTDPGLARGVKWTGPGLMHVTLLFFGEVGDDRARALCAACSRPWPAAPFRIRFGALGVFPATGPARVVWIGVNEGARELAALHALAVERLGPFVAARDRRPFSAHLTLGRFRQPPRHDVRGLLSDADEAHAGSSLVSGVTLYRSHLSSRGPTYEVETRGELTA